MTTTALVPVFAGTLAGQPTQLCNARDLHATLEVAKDFTDWIKYRIEQYGFIEGEDYSPNLGKTSRRGGRPATDYHLTLDMAKELAMVENNERGRQVRRYFIQIEKDARAKVPNAPQSAGAGGTVKALPSNRKTLDATTHQRINRRAWAVAQATFERYQHELTRDVELNLLFDCTIETWVPPEFRVELLQQLAAAATICDCFSDNMHRKGRQLAAMVGLDYDQATAKLSATKKP